MKYIIHRGIKIPLIGFGTYRLGDDINNNNQEITTYQYGINNYDMTLIDTAEMYGLGKSEKQVGKIIKDYNRNNLFIIDKILPENAKKDLYFESCKKSLSLLNTDYIDLYLLHWRSDVDLTLMVKRMEELKELGLIKNWGVSNFDVEEMEELFSIKDGNKCFCNQVLYNIGARGIEFDLLPWCKKNDVLLMAYSPLYNNTSERERYTKNNLILDIAKEEDKTAESLLLSFIIRNNDVITIFKTSNLKHLNDNMKNVFIPISENNLKLIDEAYPAPTSKTNLLKI